MLYAIKEKNESDSETYFMTNEWIRAFVKGGQDERRPPRAINLLSLENVVGDSGDPRFKVSWDPSKTNTLVSKDIALLDAYLQEAQDISKLEPYNPERKNWEGERKGYVTRTC